jgi:serine/threonine-protein kinase
MTVAIGTRLGQYEVLSLLGAGGMGEVYRARDTRLDRDVAVKVIPAHLADDPATLGRFEREAKAIAALSHPNILAIHDFSTDQVVPFVVMELLEGETLRSRLERSVLVWQKAVEIGTAVADGLAAAHAKGIVHRDLKPENIFLTSDGQVKILDFGLARLTGKSSAESFASALTASPGTDPGTVMGTAGYMSPEQVRGETAEAPSDMFSLGCVLYEMTAGRRAFSHRSTLETMSAILRDDPPSVTSSGRAIPSDLERAITHCLEKKPEERFQSARDLAFALRSIASSRPDLTASVAARPRRRTLTVVVVALALIGAAAAYSLLTRTGRPAAGAEIRSLAVLPLENVSRDPEQDYFADGMTEALITDLSKIGALRVISRTSVMRYKTVKKSLPEIARELNVDAVVEGTVVRSGDRVRISAQLIEAATDRHLWAESYERDLRDVLALQSEVARAVAREIRITVTQDERTRLERSRSVNPEAHEALLKGRFHWNTRTLDGLTRSVDYFRRAIELDPENAPAYAGLSDSYGILGNNEFMAAHEAFPKAKSAVQSALKIDDSLAEAHVSLANVMQNYDWDWAGAEREYARGLQLNPSYAAGHQWRAFYLIGQGRNPEALSEIKRARELDPLSPRINSNVGLIHYYARDFDAALQELQKSLDLDPLGSRWFLAWVYIQKGMFKEAVDACLERNRLLDGAGSALPELAYAYAAAGRKAEAQQTLKRIRARSQHSHIPPSAVALTYVALGDRELGLDILEQALADKQLLFYWVKADARFDPIRAEPRFQRILERMGLRP